MEYDSAKFSCEFCTQKFSMKKNLLRHHRTLHQEAKYMHVCDTCGKAFSRTDSLKGHMKTHQDSTKVKPDQEDQADQRLTCSQCKSQFLEQNQFDEHMKTHRLEETYFCNRPNCGQIYHRSAKFMKHVNSHRQPILPKSKKRVADHPTNRTKSKYRKNLQTI